MTRFFIFVNFVRKKKEKKKKSGCPVILSDILLV